MSTRASADPFAAGMRAAMDGMMHAMHAAKPTGDPDVDFLAMMIPHHQGAIDMARLVLIYGRDPPARRLAEEIIAGQQVEIDGMRRRLAQLRTAEGSREHAPTEDFPALGGTRGP